MFHCNWSRIWVANNAGVSRFSGESNIEKHYPSDLKKRCYFYRMDFRTKNFVAVRLYNQEHDPDWKLRPNAREQYFYIELDVNIKQKQHLLINKVQNCCMIVCPLFFIIIIHKLISNCYYKS